MGVFECDRCGKCCVSLGPLITIERQLNERDYYCRCKIDNAIFLAHVDPGYHEEIADEFAAGGLDRNSTDKKPCTFLRKNPDDDGTTCAIYTSRPAVCRDFRCYRMLLRNKEGAICGRVIGKNTIRTEDAALKKIWDEEVAAIPYGDAVAWTKIVAGILVKYSYCADPVE
jgi:Fe-S-cluster containining protein